MMTRTRLFDRLRSSIIGQDLVLTEICDLVERAMDGFKYYGEPVSVLSLGATGTGKTETVLLICKECFGEIDKNLARFDMSEYMTPDTIHKMLGDGDRKGVFETMYERIGRKGILLFDETEKGHTLVIDILHQILSAGRITVSSGRTLDISEYLIFCTSNVGSTMLMTASARDQRTIMEWTEADALEELKRPELVGRFTLLAAYAKLTQDHTLAIAELHAGKALEIFKNLGHRVSISRKAIGYIRAEGYSEKFGVRPIRTKAMQIIGRAVKMKQLETGLKQVSGLLDYDPKTGKYGIKSLD